MAKARPPSALDRRRLLLGSGAAFLASRAGEAAAQAGELIVANWGGDWNERIKAAVEAPLSARTGMRITHVLSEQPQRKTKLLAERQLPRGTFDVAHFTDDVAYEMTVLDLLEDVDLAKLANGGHVDKNLLTPTFVPLQYSAWVIIYNPDRIKEPPTSYADLYDKRYAGRVGINNQHFVHNMQAAGLLNGGSDKDFEKIKEKLLSQKRDVSPRLYPTHQQLAAALKNEEVWICCNFKARALQWQADGLNLSTAYPKEGGFVTVFGASIPRRARNVDGARKYVEASIDPKNVGALVSKSFYSPTIDNAEIPGDLKAKLDFTPEERSRLRTRDHAYLADNLSPWLEWWDKSFAS